LAGCQITVLGFWRIQDQAAIDTHSQKKGRTMTTQDNLSGALSEGLIPKTAGTDSMLDSILSQKCHLFFCFLLWLSRSLHSINRFIQKKKSSPWCLCHTALPICPSGNLIIGFFLLQTNKKFFYYF
jgi:hypothetical protein